MITRTPAHVPTDPAAMAAPGGFAWWYLDLVDEHGQGLVIIWSFGLPFLPGYAASARAGTAPPACTRPSLTISAYADGQIAFYDFQEYPAEDAHHDPEAMTWSFGASTLRWLDDATTGERTLSMVLDRPIPGTSDRLTGTVEVRGRLCHGPPPALEAHDAPNHVWSPMLLGCEGTADLRAGDFTFQIHGRAYHDRNAATVPLHALGIGQWWWGRLSFADRDFIWYRLQPDDGGPIRQMTLSVDRNGYIQEISTPLELGADIAGHYGLSSPSTVHFFDEDSHPVVAALESCVDDGPFYQRHLVRGMYKGETGRGVAEFVVPHQVDRDLHRPFVRMRVQQMNGGNSPFLPLFTGPRSGRLTRLAQWWMGGQ
jgi:hypothetical protein